MAFGKSIRIYSDFCFSGVISILKFSMNKKLIISLALLLSAAAANTQFHFGGQVSINFENERTSYNSGVVNNKENAYIVSLKPKLYWNINDKMQVGGRIGFAFGRLTSGTIYDSEVKDPVSIVTSREAGPPGPSWNHFARLVRHKLQLCRQGCHHKQLGRSQGRSRRHCPGAGAAGIRQAAGGKNGAVDRQF